MDTNPGNLTRRFALWRPEIKDRAVLITGCSSGIGHATAERLVRHTDWTVYASARRVSEIEDLGQAGCRLMTLDVTDEASRSSAIESITEDMGGIAGLVNNAGYSQSGALESLELDQVRRQLETNVLGLLRLSQLALPSMRAAGFGRIINLSSMGGVITFPGGGAYHASKHAVEAISDVLRWEVGGFGVDIVVIQPGLVRTGFAEAAVDSLAAIESGPYSELNAAVAAITQGAYERGLLARLGTGPEKVARVIEQALTARRPRTRYRTDLAGRLLLWFHTLVTDRMWDGTQRRIYPQPRP